MTAYLIPLRAIRAAGPCGIKPGEPGGWALLLRTLGEPHGRPNLDRLVSLGDVALSNGADDAIWCSRAFGHDLAAWRMFVRAVPLAAALRAARPESDPRVHECNALVSRWCDGEDISAAALRKVARAARAAASAAALAAAAAGQATDAAWAAVWAVSAAADAADEAAWAAGAAGAAARAARAAGAAAEHEAQQRDILAAFPPYALAGSPT